MFNQNVPSVLAHMKTNGNQIANMGHYVKSTVRTGQAPRGCSEFKSKVFALHGKPVKNKISDATKAYRQKIELSRAKREAVALAVAKIRNGEVIRKTTKTGQMVFVAGGKFTKNPFQVLGGI